LYETIAKTIQILLPFINKYKDKRVIEPCCGKSQNIVNVLKESGFENVTASDLNFGKERKDFFKINLNDYDFIITVINTVELEQKPEI
jgi:hypothetical protein